jgi:OTU domain-containing protein 3
LADIEKDGTWGGQLEIQALSVVHNFNCIVHQVDNPIMVFSNYPLGTVKTIHISYHLGEHYNSVRLINDPCDGVPLVIGHELKLKEQVVNLEEEKKEEVRVSNEIPTRLDIVIYALE